MRNFVGKVKRTLTYRTNTCQNFLLCIFIKQLRKNEFIVTIQGNLVSM